MTRLKRAGLRYHEAHQVRRLLTGRMVRQFKIEAAQPGTALGHWHRASDVVSVLGWTPSTGGSRSATSPAPVPTAAVSCYWHPLTGTA